MPPVIRFENVSKKYRLGSRLGDLREFVPDPLAAARRWWRWRNGNGDPHDEAEQVREVWALNDVSFEVEEGEALGIIGPNGAGKSTILKLLAGITEPTRGRIETRGRVSALIEVGAGFHPDLTGRENVYLNGSILGMNKREIDSRFDSIIEFAELERFTDTPVKRYSSGMYVRLGFSVAMQMDPQVLLVDEVLAVGDVAFQSKSFSRMAQMIQSGCTVIFVSHNVSAVRQVCPTALLLWQGEIAELGPARNVTQTYLERVRDQERQEQPRSSLGHDVRHGHSAKGRIADVTFLGEVGRARGAFVTGEAVAVTAVIETFSPLHRPILRVEFFRAGRERLALFDTEHDGVDVGTVAGTRTIRLVIPALHLPVGDYRVSVCLSDQVQMNHVDWHDRAYVIEVTEGSDPISPTALPREWGVTQ